ncbi:MAG: hypothetical protein ACK559_27730, partial [bacterium]
REVLRQPVGRLADHDPAAGPLALARLPLARRPLLHQPRRREQRRGQVRRAHRRAPHADPGAERPGLRHGLDLIRREQPRGVEAAVPRAGVAGLAPRLHHPDASRVLAPVEAGGTAGR